jgi:CheY-like chemotaxis protein
MMPVMDGWTFRAEQLKDPRLSDVPVVILSGGREVAQEATNLRAAPFLVKPFKAVQLMSAVETYCGAGRQVPRRLTI